eukprot:sb/3466943/
MVSCNQCDEVFESSSDLLRHKATKHIPVVAVGLRNIIDTGKRKREENDRDERIDKRERGSIMEHTKSRKRKEFDSDLDTTVMKRSRKRAYIETSDDDVNDGQPIVTHRDHEETSQPQLRLDYYKKQIRTLTNKLQRANNDTQGFKRRYEKKLKECNDNLTRYSNTISLLKKQNQEFEVRFNDPHYKEFSKSIVNSVSIENFIRIKSLLEKGKLNYILRSKQLLDSLQTLIMGLQYGVIPLVVQQSQELTSSDRNLISKLENVSREEVKQIIYNNKNSFIHLFNIIAESIDYLKRVNDNKLNFSDRVEESEYSSDSD